MKIDTKDFAVAEGDEVKLRATTRVSGVERSAGPPLSRMLHTRGR
jgi:hypothetical protein